MSADVLTRFYAVNREFVAAYRPLVDPCALILAPTRQSSPFSHPVPPAKIMKDVLIITTHSDAFAATVRLPITDPFLDPNVSCLSAKC